MLDNVANAPCQTSTFGRIMKKLIFASLALLLLSGCAYSRNYVSRSSEHRAYFSKWHKDEDIRARLMSATPLGMERSEVDKLIQKDFSKGIRDKPDISIPEKFKHAAPESFVCVRFKVSGQVPIGSSWTEAIWFFDESDRLIEIHVMSYGVWL